MENILSIRGLSKCYGDFTALENTDLELTNGVYAFLGLNGAGKTTFINMITDNAARTTGEILYNGTEIKKLSAKYRDKIGYMPQEQGYYGEFTGREYLAYIANLKGVNKKKDKIEQLLVQFNLVEKADIKIKKYSGGMRQRIVLAQTMLNNPEIIVLDEPTVGLDPLERNKLKEYIKDISKEKIVIYCTHIVSDVMNFADQFIFMKNGKICKIYNEEQMIKQVQEGKTIEDVVLAILQ